jgi:hypothetical protein
VIVGSLASYSDSVLGHQLANNLFNIELWHMRYTNAALSSCSNKSRRTT